MHTCACYLEIIVGNRGLIIPLKGFCFPVWGWWDFNICVFTSTGVTLRSRAVHRSTTWKHLSKPFTESGWPVLRKLWHIETTLFKKFMTNLRKWRKLTHEPRFPASSVKPKNHGARHWDKTQMSFVREACVAFFSTWSLTQLSTHFLEFYWFRMLSWIRNFLATNGMGYDNSQLSDDIHRLFFSTGSWSVLT